MPIKMPFGSQSPETVEGGIQEELTRIFNLVNNDQKMQATLAIKKLMGVEASTAMTTIREMMEKSYGNHNWEVALFFGQTLLEYNQNDYLLSNLVGNCFRQLGDYLSANNYYKQAFSLNRDFELALLNIAASLAKIDRYDEELNVLKNSYPIVNQEILPDFMVDPKSILHEKISKILISEWRIQINEYLQELILQEEIAQINKQTDDVHAIQKKINKEKDRNFPEKLSVSRCRIILLKLMGSRWDFLPPDRRSLLEIAVFDMVLYDFKEQKYREAQRHLQKLKQNQSTLFYIDFMINMCHWKLGNEDEAIVGMKAFYGDNPKNRYTLINLGRMYGKRGNRLQKNRFLLMAAIRIEELNGQILCTDILNNAKHRADTGELAEAISLYKVIVKEVNTIEIWQELGDLYQKVGNPEKAVTAYKKAQAVNPNSKKIAKLLQRLHDSWLEKADELNANNQFPKAIEYFELALKIFRSSLTLKKAGQTYAILKKPGKSQQMLQDSQNLELEEEKQQEEIKLKNLIEQGKADLKARNYNPAINNFRTAFEIRPSKDAFMFLVTIYKSLNQKRALIDLMDKWKTHTAYESKMEKMENRTD
ncbi:MAG: tetratricopeptide repeat protein [Proteobacteria bacterium]|nr:tetratricopeptide repeat protein [Pseudomonadota bacterium]